LDLPHPHGPARILRHGGGKPALTFNAAVPEGWKEIPTDDAMMFMTKEGGYKQFVSSGSAPSPSPFSSPRRR